VNRHATLRRKTVDLAFDGEQDIDALDRLGRDRRLLASAKLSDGHNTT
jgi:hypothetical protein